MTTPGRRRGLATAASTAAIWVGLACFPGGIEAVETDPFAFLKDVPYVCPLPLEEGKPLDESPVGRGFLNLMFPIHTNNVEELGIPVDALCEAFVEHLKNGGDDSGDDPKPSPTPTNPGTGGDPTPSLTPTNPGEGGDPTPSQTPTNPGAGGDPAPSPKPSTPDGTSPMPAPKPATDGSQPAPASTPTPATNNPGTSQTSGDGPQVAPSKVSGTQPGTTNAKPAASNGNMNLLLTRMLAGFLAGADGAGTDGGNIPGLPVVPNMAKPCEKTIGKMLATFVRCGDESFLQSTCGSSIKPGHFCIRNERCVLMKRNDDGKMIAASQLCPKGFYCRGGEELPVACPKGFKCSEEGSTDKHGCPGGQMCILPGNPINCSRDDAGLDDDVVNSTIFAGVECMPDKNDRIILAKPCRPGSNCVSGIPEVCPEGHICPEGTAEPIACVFGEICPKGSQAPARWWRAVAEASLMSIITVVILTRLSTVRMGTGDCTWRVPIIILGLGAAWAYELVRNGMSSKVMLQHLFFFSIYIWELLWGIFGPMLSGRCPRPVFLALEFVISMGPLGVLYGTGLPWELTVFLVAFWPFTWMIHYLILSGTGHLRVKGAIMALSTLLIVSLPCLLGIQPLGHLFVVTVLLLTFILAKLARVMLTLCRKSAEEEDLRIAREASEPSSIELMASHSNLPNAGNPTGALPAGQSESSVDEENPRSVSAASPTSTTEGGVDHVPTSFEKRPGVSIGLRDVCLFLPSGTPILRSVSLNIPAGCSVAIMGPSGSGKSSITNVLSGRAGYGKVTGEILINGTTDIGIGGLQSVVGFVPQDDVMHRNLTCAETVAFQAALRLPKHLRKEGDWAHAETQETLKRIGLDHVQNTLIGDEHVRGISGGQRKRVSIAMEFISKPALLFLDEPTSGLDSTTSHSVIELVAENARTSNCTSLAVIHQPRYETFLLFDYTILLAAGGYLAYAGKTTEAMGYFQSKLGVSFPSTANPADIFMDAISVESAAKLASQGMMAVPQDSLESRDALGALLSKVWKKNAKHFGCSATKPDEVPLPKLDPEVCSWAEGMLAQVQRAAIQAKRSLGQSLGFSGVMVLGVGSVLGGVPGDCVFNVIFQPGLVLFFVMLCQSVSSHRHFGGAERVVAWREAGTGSNMILYFLGRDLCAIMEVMMGTIVLTLTYWPMMPLLMSHHTFFWATFAYIYAIYGMGFILSIMFDPNTAQMVSVFCSFICFLFLGVQPAFVDVAKGTNGGIFYVTAFSPLRWMHGFLMREHILRTPDAGFNNRLIQLIGKDTMDKVGLPLEYIRLAGDNSTDAWMCEERSWDRWLGDPETGRPPISSVCNVTPLYMLGIWFRFLAVVWLLVVSKSHVTGNSAVIDGVKKSRRNSALVNAGFDAFMLALTNFTVCMLLSSR